MKRYKFSFNNLLKSNKIILLISFLAAVAIWITISPNRVKTISIPVKIDVDNSTASSLGLEVIEGLGQFINVDVSGKWHVLSKLDDNDMTASVAVSDVTKAGNYKLNVSVKKSFSGSDFDIIKVSPEKISVSFDNIYTRGYSVEAVASKIKAKEGYILGTPVPEFSTINIEGPQTIIETINKVVAVVEEEAVLENSQAYLTKLKVLDDNGNEIDTGKLMLPFSEVNVTIPINISKMVPIKARFINNPGDISSIKYTLSEKEINLIGSNEVLSGFNEVALEAIDFTEVDVNNNFFDIQLKLPSGIISIDDIDFVTVIIDTSKLDSKSIDVNNFKAINNNGLNVSVTTTKKAVKVVGPENVITNIKSSDLYLEYDLGNVSENAGEILIPCVLKSNNYDSVWGYGQYQIQIKVK